MKKLVTHLNPHLDDIVGMWLFARLHPDFAEAELLFKAKGEIETLSGEAADSDPDVIYIGTGMGKFDEHKGDLDDSAATLVWKYIVTTGFAPKDELTSKAYGKIVDYTFLEDTAKLETVPYHSFSLPAIINSHLHLHKNSEKTTRLLFEILDSLVDVQKEEVVVEQDWPARVEFETKWGKGVALRTDSSKPADYAYKNGFVLAILERPTTGYKGYRAQSTSDVDLTETYNKLKELEPDADWYLHHSKRLLLCGSDVSENKNLSKLSLNELIELVKK